MAFDPDAYLAKKQMASPVENPKASGFDPDAYLAKKTGVAASVPANNDNLDFIDRAEQGVYNNVIAPVVENVVAPVGKFVDRYTGAPARAGLNDLVEGKGLLSAASTAANQFGADPERAPTGKVIAQKLGAPETSLSDKIPSLYSDTGSEWLKLKRGGILDPTASGVAGLGIDVAADPTNLIPGKAIASGLGKAAKFAGELGANTSRLAGKALIGATDIVTGTQAASKAASKTAEIAKDTANAIKNISAPKRVAEYDRLASTAQKIGINPEDMSAAAEFGKGSTASRLERNIGEGLLGQKLLDKAEHVSNKLAEATDQTIKQLGQGKVYDPVASGELLKSAYSNAEKEVLGNSHLTYKTAAQLNPGMQLTPQAYGALSNKLKEVENVAQELAKKGATREQLSIGKDLYGMTQRMRKSGASYKDLADQISFIGDAMTDPNINRFHAKQLRGVYKELSNSLIDTVKDIHPDLGQQLVENNKKLSEFFKSRELLGNAIQDSAANPESVFKALSGDSVKIDELKKVLKPEEFSGFRASYLDSLVKRNAEGNILYDSTIKNIKKNQGRLSKMFTPDEMGQLGDILELGHAQGSPVLSSSGTGASNMFSNAIKNVSSAVLNEGLLNKLKARGRGASEALAESKGLLESPAPSLLSEPVVSSPGLLDQGKALLRKTGAAQRGTRRNILKGAQSIAPQYYDQERSSRNE